MEEEKTQKKNACVFKTHKQKPRLTWQMVMFKVSMIMED
jgi:hypothetical protein